MTSKRVNIPRQAQAEPHHLQGLIVEPIKRNKRGDATLCAINVGKYAPQTVWITSAYLEDETSEP